MERVIISGASGFIGQALTAGLLAENCHVLAIVRDKAKLKEMCCANLEIVEAELSDYGLLAETISGRNFDAFFHLAWDGTFGSSFMDYHRQLHNAACAADALSAAAKLNCKKFILAGTIVQLEVKHYLMIDDGDSKPRTACNYGTAKLAAEMLCRTLAHRLSIPFNTAMMANVYGRGDCSRMIQNVLIHSLQHGEDMRLINGETLHDWIYIDDVVSGLIAIAARGKPNKTYYVGHRELQTFRELVTQTRDIVAPLAQLRFGTIEDQTEIDYTLVDRDALFCDTGFVCQTELAEGIRQTAKWVETLDWKKM